jgi:coenzyme F420 hydrogenase subunit delta
MDIRAQATENKPQISKKSSGIGPEENRTEDEIEGKEILVIGCGNVLLGDDGLGPAFIKYLSGAPVDSGINSTPCGSCTAPRGRQQRHKKSKFKNNIGFVDAGTSIRTILFNLVLSDKKPEHIIIIDAVDKGKKPGEIFEISLEDVPPLKSDDFSMHQLPTSNLLKELRDECLIKVEVIAVQVESIPEQIKCGLSEPVAKSIPKLYDIIIKKLN